MGEHSLFCYGTLQSPLVMKAVTGKAYSGEEAKLQGWARYRFNNTEYPGIIVENGAFVSGKLYWGVDDEAMMKLDAFEGDKYERVMVPLTFTDGRVEEAWAYSVKDEFRKKLLDEPWDFDRFLQRGLERFIAWFVEDRRDLLHHGDI